MPSEPDDGPDAPDTAAAEPPRADQPAGAPASPPGGRWRRRRRRILIWGSASLAVLLVAVLATGYTLLRHFNANIQQDDIKGLLGKQPVNLHPQAENILVLGSDTRYGQGSGYGTGLVTDQSDTLMIMHIPADRKWAEVMSIPRDSWVNIPACTMGDGQLSAPTQFKINEAFAIGNLDGNHTALGVACTVKTVEQDTGIYINHFIVVNFSGFKDMVAALGGVEECNPTPIDDPLSNLHLSAGYHMLTPTQALGYVRARYTLGDGSDLERIGRQQAFMSSLISRVKGQLLNPLAIYRFLDAATHSLTIDSELGGITGLYDLRAVAAGHAARQDRVLHAAQLPAQRSGPGGHRQRAVDAAGRQPDLRLLPRRRAGEQLALRRSAREPASGPHCRRAPQGRRHPEWRRDAYGAGGERQPRDEPERHGEFRRPPGTHREPEHLRRLRPRRDARRIPLTG